MGKITTRLPPALEENRLLIAKRHNKMVMGLLFLGLPNILLASIIATAFLKGFLPPGAALSGSIAIFGVLYFYWLVAYLSKHDDRLCRALGFICPSCHEPLYVVMAREAGSSRLRAGFCPRCGADLKQGS